MWFNVMRLDQSLKASTCFIPSDYADQGNLSPETRRDHGDCSCTAQASLFLLDANHNAGLLRIQLRGVANQITIKD